MQLSGVEYSRIVTNNYAQVLFFDTMTPEMVIDNTGYKIMNQEQGQSGTNGSTTIRLLQQLELLKY
jgi:hypothetical protein